MFEIFVYSTRFEGVHLRGGKVARGGCAGPTGQDFRTEVRVSSGADGQEHCDRCGGLEGRLRVEARAGGVDRDAFMKEGIACYQDYLRGLLDLTDNRVGDSIVAPPR
jgi:glutamate dehydrogenase